MKRIFSVLSICLLLCFSINLSAQEIFNAIIQKDIQKVKEILEQDSSLANSKNPRGFSPIHFAANFNLIEIAKALKAAGADINIQDDFGRRPMHWAASTNNIEILKWLNQFEQDFNLTDKQGKSALYVAVTRKAGKAVEFLISKNVSIISENENGFNMFYEALVNNYIPVIDAYFNSSIDLAQKDIIGSNLLFAASLNKNEENLNKLIEKGLDVNAVNDFGESPLITAIQNNNLKAIEALIKNNAAINSTNTLGKSALDIAKELKNEEAINLLLSHNAQSKWNIESFTDKYPDLNMPGLTAEIFGEGYISTSEFNERDVMFSPSADEFYFSRNGGQARMPMTVHLMNKYNSYWSLPVIASFSGKFSDAECFITKDNQKLFFISKRPDDGSEKPAAWEIWIADRKTQEQTHSGAGPSQWTNIHKIDTLLKGCFYPTITLDGELFYTDAKNNLLSAKIDGEKITDIKKLNENINTPQGGGYNSMVSPDGSFFIFTTHAYPNDFGGGDLYICFRDPGSDWGKAINMGEAINSEFTEYCPSLSPDGKFFFFTSNRKGSEDIYWIDAQIIQNLRMEKE